MIVDYHTHLRAPDTSLDHTVDGVERFVERAVERGIDEIGFSEHVYYFRQTRHLWSNAYHLRHCHEDIEDYVDAVTTAKERGLPVKLGLEVDYEPGREQETAEALASYPWDYVLGSIHFVGDYGIDGEPSLVDAVGSEQAWETYFELLGRATRSGLFDSLAHPDLVKMYGAQMAWDWARVARGLDGTCIEVSSAGLHKPHGRMYPEAPFLEEALAHGVPITLASDAHCPQDVGRDLDRAVAHAREAGYASVTVFDRRVRKQVPLG